MEMANELYNYKTKTIRIFCSFLPQGNFIAAVKFFKYKIEKAYENLSIFLDWLMNKIPHISIISTF